MTDEELARLAAEKVMGFVLCDRGGPPHDFWGVPDRTNEPWRVLMDRRVNWSPLTDWRAAGEIIEKMRADGWRFRIAGKFTSFFRDDMSNAFIHRDEVIPRAITMAALLAVGAITEADL